MPEIPIPGAELDYANPQCPLTSAEVLVITSFEAIVIGEYLRWLQLDTDPGD